MVRKQLTKGVEDLNPRSHAVRDLRMSVERCLMLKDLIAEHFMRCQKYGISPYFRPVWGDDSFQYVDRKGYVGTLVRKIWGDDYYAHPEYRQWDELVRMWRRGSLDRQIADMAANLPASARKKLGV